MLDDIICFESSIYSQSFHIRLSRRKYLCAHLFLHVKESCKTRLTLSKVSEETVGHCKTIGHCMAPQSTKGLGSMLLQFAIQEWISKTKTQNNCSTRYKSKHKLFWNRSCCLRNVTYQDWGFGVSLISYHYVPLLTSIGRILHLAPLCHQAPPPPSHRFWARLLGLKPAVRGFGPCS